MKLKNIFCVLLILGILINVNFLGIANAEVVENSQTLDSLSHNFIETTTSSQLDLDLSIKRIANFEDLKSSIDIEKKLVIENTILINEDFTFQNDVEFIRANNFDGDLFQVSRRSDVVLKNFKVDMTDSSINKGSVFVVDQGGTLEVLNGTFIGNKSELSGSVIHNKGNVTIENAIIKNNGSNSDGGAIYNEGQLNIGGGQFEGNISKSNGGAIYDKGIMSIYGGYFENNSSNSFGGALYSESKFDLRAAKFQNNSQTEIIAGKYNNTVFAKEGFSAYGDYYPVSQPFYSEKDVINNSNMLEINALSYFEKLINNEYLVIEDKLVVNAIENKTNIDWLEISPNGTLEILKELIGGILNNGKLNIMYSGKFENEIKGNGTIVYKNPETMIFETKTQNNILIKEGIVKAQSNKANSNDIIFDGGIYLVEGVDPQDSKKEQMNVFYINANNLKGDGFVNIKTNKEIQTDKYYYFGKYNNVESTVKATILDESGKALEIPKGYRVKIESDDQHNYYAVLREIPKDERIYYTVIFKDNELELSKITVEENEDIVPIEAPLKEGYEFIGWYNELIGGKPINDFSNITKSMTVYARYEKKENAKGGGRTVEKNDDEDEGEEVVYKMEMTEEFENNILKDTKEVINTVNYTKEDKNLNLKSVNSNKKIASVSQVKIHKQEKERFRKEKIEPQKIYNNTTQTNNSTNNTVTANNNVKLQPEKKIDCKIHLYMTILLISGIVIDLFSIKKLRRSK